LLGYVYWRFGDIDAAIASTENALNLTSKYDWVDRDIHMFKIKDNLAYYYADKGINEEKAFSYVDQIDTFDFIDDIEKAKHLDTKGFVYMKFGKNKEDIQKSINCFTESLAVREDIDTDSSDVLFQRACLPISSPYLMKALHNQEVMDIHI
jgi:tetratricopeptide (TPR) repeat protein